MILGDAIRITDSNLRESYWAKNKNGYQILDQNSHNNGIVLYCQVKDGAVIGAVEVCEDLVTRDEKIIARFGMHEKVTSHFNIQ